MIIFFILLVIFTMALAFIIPMWASGSAQNVELLKAVDKEAMNPFAMRTAIGMSIRSTMIFAALFLICLWFVIPPKWYDWLETDAE